MRDPNYPVYDDEGIFLGMNYGQLPKPELDAKRLLRNFPDEFSHALEIMYEKMYPEKIGQN